MNIRKNGSHKFIFALAMGILISWAAAAKTSEKWDAETTARVNLRRNPGPNGVILGIVPKGRKVRLIEKKGLWFKVNVEGETHGKGWVYAEYLEEFLPKALEAESTSYLEETLPRALETESASYLEEFLPKALEAESTSYLEETLPRALETESDSYSEETLPKVLETESAAETVRVENTSRGPTQVIHPAELPPKVRTPDNKENLLNTAPPAKASRVRVMQKLSIRDEFRSGQDKSIADSKRDVPMAGDAAHFGPSQVSPEAGTAHEKAKLANASLPPTISIAGAKKPPSVRNELQQANHESNTQSQVQPLLAGEPVLMPPTEPPYSGFKQGALGTAKESSPGAVEHGYAAPHQKSLPGGENKQDGALKKTAFAVRKKAVTDSHAVAAPKRKEPLFRSELMRPAKRVLKLLSIVLSCLVLLLLYMENKTATQRYIEQTEYRTIKAEASRG